MKIIRNIVFAVFLILLITGLFTSCEEIRSYPETPSVKYLPPFTLTDTTDELGNDIYMGFLKFEFTDGDGDLGLSQPDSIGLADSLIYNLYLDLYEKGETGFTKVEDLDEMNFRIPYIEREGQNKTLIGTISVDLEYTSFKYDTVFYTFYIVDRDFNESNIDTSEVIIFSRLVDSLQALSVR